MRERPERATRRDPVLRERGAAGDHGPIDWTGLTSIRTAKSALEIFTIIALALAVFFGIELFLRWSDTPSYVFPKPVDVVQSLLNDFTDLYAHHLWVTMQEFLIGFAIGAASGSCSRR